MPGEITFQISEQQSSGQQYSLNDIRKTRQKWLVKKSKFV